MEYNRDFKGVWIPKDIWLSTELTLTEKALFVEIDSLDNDDHCTASNKYFADFLGVAERTISRGITKLLEMELIEIVSFDGRQRVMKVSKQIRQNVYAAQKNCLTNNIDNNINDNSKELSYEESDVESHRYSDREEKQFLRQGKKQTRNKSGKNLYSKCVDEIYRFDNSLKVQTLLIEYLDMRLKMKDKPMYYNQWVAILRKLKDISVSENTDMEDIIKQSLEKGYASFYPISKYTRSNKAVFSEGTGLSSEQSHDTIDERIAQLEKTGRRAEF